jgi:gamma-glutamyltranspeptidase / glutathione hydrolase
VARLLAFPFLALTLAVVIACGPPETPGPPGPRQAPGERQAERFMVSAAHPLAVEAGLEMMRRGGSAVDAAIAVQFVLGFVEAPETGIGGGGFLLHLDAASGQVEFLDGRETAPAAATPERFTLLGQPVPRVLAIPTGRAVGVPGLVALLELAHERHGRLAWSELAQPAIRLAEDGVPMPGRLQRESGRDLSLRLFADTRRMFHAPARRPGEPWRNPDYAASLRKIAADGAAAFYQGEIADSLVERVRARRPWAADMTLEDLQSYRALERAPVCAPYRRWTVCGAAPPSSGGVAVLQILGMLERFPMATLGPDSAEAIHLLIEAHRLAFADRERYLGDPDFVTVPVEGLLERDYLARRSLLIDPQRAMDRALPGTPSPAQPAAGMNGPTAAGGGTSHVTIVDAQGNVVALTSSVEAPFGSRMSVGGFLLNNQLTDFSFRPRDREREHPNAVAPGKRPGSSMSPVIVLDEQGEVRLAIGARGGSRIIAYVAKALLGVLDWELDIQEAIALPNFAYTDGRLELERGTALATRREEFRARGHRVREAELASGLHGIERHGEGWRGGADPRLEGVARGD